MSAVSPSPAPVSTRPPSGEPASPAPGTPAVAADVSPAAHRAALREAYAAELADGVARFFQPPVAACPWCGGHALEPHLVTRDLYQHKPGVFQLDRCGDCGHVFQNPQLNPAGLAFYYRDFYDGINEAKMARMLASGKRNYRRRAEALLAFDAAPANWLDVGCGHGHFCEAAQAIFPATAFHGLDFSEGARIAERAGRVSKAYSGLLVDFAPSLAGQYAVVSMYHYLEHSPLPQRELEAAHTLLAPGGHFIVEVPDPECRWAGWLGKWWGPWLQPQHLHFIPVSNMRRRLEESGFEVVAEQHQEPHIPVDLASAVWLRVRALVPYENLPWQPRRGLLAQSARAVAYAVRVPLMLGAALVDLWVLKPWAARLGLSNTYRLIARKR